MSPRLRPLGGWGRLRILPVEPTLPDHPPSAARWRATALPESPLATAPGAARTTPGHSQLRTRPTAALKRKPDAFIVFIRGSRDSMHPPHAMAPSSPEPRGPRKEEAADPIPSQGRCRAGAACEDPSRTRPRPARRRGVSSRSRDAGAGGRHPHGGHGRPGRAHHGPVIGPQGPFAGLSDGDGP
jgi:hypothetical protein